MTALVTMTLGQCCEIVSGATPQTSVSEYWDGDIYWATPKDLSDLNGHFIASTPRKITKAGLSSCAATVLPANSVLFSSRAPIGHVAVNTTPMATNQGFKSFIPRHDLLEPKFLFHWLRAKRPYLEALGNGATFKEVSKAVVARVEIALPPLPTQRRIAAILDQADALRAKRREALTQLDSLTQSIFIEMFGDPSQSTPSFPSYALDALLASPLQNGAYYPKESYSADGVEMVHMSDAFNGIVNRGALKRVDCSVRDLSKYRLLESDILIARRSLTYEGAAKPCRVPASSEPLIFESSFIRVSPDPSKVETEYLFRYLQNERVRQKHIRPFVTQSTISGINQSNLEQVSVVVPPIDLQRVFAARIHGVETLKATHLAALLESDALFASLQHRAFAGQL